MPVYPIAASFLSGRYKRSSTSHSLWGCWHYPWGAHPSSCEPLVYPGLLDTCNSVELSLLIRNPTMDIYLLIWSSYCLRPACCHQRYCFVSCMWQSSQHGPSWSQSSDYPTFYWRKTDSCQAWCLSGPLFQICWSFLYWPSNLDLLRVLNISLTLRMHFLYVKIQT